MFENRREEEVGQGGARRWWCRVGLGANREQNNMQEQQPFGQNESKPTKPAAKWLRCPTQGRREFLTNASPPWALGLLSCPKLPKGAIKSLRRQTSPFSSPPNPSDSVCLSLSDQRPALLSRGAQIVLNNKFGWAKTSLSCLTATSLLLGPNHLSEEQRDSVTDVLIYTFVDAVEAACAQPVLHQICIGQWWSGALLILSLVHIWS